MIDPNDARRVFASYEEVLRSLDRAENWEVVSRLEDNVASFYYPPTANAMAIAPSDSAIVYAGGASNDYYSGFVSRSEDRGTVWSAPATLSSPVRTLAVDPCDPGSCTRGPTAAFIGARTQARPGVSRRSPRSSTRSHWIPDSPRPCSPELGRASSGPTTRERVGPDSNHFSRCRSIRWQSIRAAGSSTPRRTRASSASSARSSLAWREANSFAFWARGSSSP